MLHGQADDAPTAEPTLAELFGDRERRAQAARAGESLFGALRAAERDPAKWLEAVQAAVQAAPVAALHTEDPEERARPLSLAARIPGLEPALAAMIERGADVHAKDDLGNTALHDAASPEAVRVLVTHLASPSALNDQGRTPLHSASVDRDRPAGVVAELLAYGAPPEARDKRQQTAAEISMEHLREAERDGAAQRPRLAKALDNVRAKLAAIERSELGLSIQAPEAASAAAAATAKAQGVRQPPTPATAHGESHPTAGRERPRGARL